MFKAWEGGPLLLEATESDPVTYGLVVANLLVPQHLLVTHDLTMIGISPMTLSNSGHENAFFGRFQTVEEVGPVEVPEATQWNLQSCDLFARVPVDLPAKQ